MNYFEKNWKKRVQYDQGDFKLDKESVKQTKNKKFEKNLAKNHLKQS